MDYEIGITLESMTPLDELDAPVKEPNSIFQDYSERLILGDGSARGVGAPVAIWTFELLEDANPRNQLKEFCPGASADVYIRTLRNDDTFGIYQAIMHWPLEESTDNHWNLKLNIKFTQLVEVSNGSGS
jgi:hypothetical protein